MAYATSRLLQKIVKHNIPQQTVTGEIGEYLKETCYSVSSLLPKYIANPFGDMKFRNNESAVIVDEFREKLGMSGMVNNEKYLHPLKHVK